MRKRYSLYYKFILRYLVFGLLSFLAIGLISSDWTYRLLLKVRSESLYDEANLLASRYSGVYQGSDAERHSLQSLIEAVGTYLRSEIWIVNSSGTIVEDSVRSARTGTVIEDFNPAFTGNQAYTVGNYHDLFAGDVISVCAPITGNYSTHGYVLIHLPVSEIMTIRDRVLNILYISSCIIFGLSLIILLVFTLTVYFPLRKITEAANRYAEGDLKHRLTLHTQDEMGYLAATMNYMAEKLDKSEEYQKNFIANVSHDFRSPLTSIKGYLEAILDGTIPPEMQDQYLQRVISETERLNKLTQGLLTLNSLDQKNLLSRSDFDLNLVIKETAASFEGTCNAKNIILDLTFSHSSTMVYADLGEIQQVLYNLIDNAIKFSHPDSTIYIQTAIKYEKVFVSVKDTGIGIPKDSLKKIWERFYKTDLSRGKDKKGTGLGLSIVKEIIQNHGETIEVISTEGVGTEFIFTLPRSTGQGASAS